MEKVFVNHSQPCSTANLTGSLTPFRDLLQRAVSQASLRGQPVLASLVLPLQASDPLWIFRTLSSLSASICSYWEQPAHQISLVGTGAALQIQTDGPAYFSDAAQAWQRLRDEALILSTTEERDQPGPALIGGFRFDPLYPHTSLWQDFPTGELVLPRLLFRQQGTQATLTLSHLVQPEEGAEDLMQRLTDEVRSVLLLLEKQSALTSRSVPVPEDYPLRDIWPAESWKGLVRETTRLIQQGTYTKVVLAREAEVLADESRAPFSLFQTLERLRAHYPAAYIFAFQRGASAFIGATPERLIRVQDGQLHTMAVAGSAPRGSTPEEDLRLGSALLASQKNREEHEIVAAMLRDSLADLCSRIWIADTPELLRLKNIQHLQTAIVGEILPERSLLEALQILHPTPAVGGMPTRPALAFIREREHLDRGWYAGPIGWLDLHGNGEFAVGLRSALLQPRSARLFAGCGIVKDSDPEAEYLESCLKLQVILRSLSGEE